MASIKVRLGFFIWRGRPTSKVAFPTLKIFGSPWADLPNS